MMKENEREFFQNGAVKHTYIYTHEGQTDRKIATIREI